MKLTKWYPKNIKPVRQGLYELKGYSGKYFFLLYDRTWNVVVEHTYDHMALRQLAEQDVRWRGLANKNDNPQFCI